MHALRKQLSLAPDRQQSPCTQATSNSGPCCVDVSTTSRAVADRGSLLKPLLHVLHERALGVPERITRFTNPTMHGGTTVKITLRATNKGCATSGTRLHFSSDSTVSLCA